MSFKALVPLSIFLFFGSLIGGVLPEPVQSFLDNHCLDCHDSETEKGEINLDYQNIDWSEKDVLNLWERIKTVVDSGEMPPKKKPRPNRAELQELSFWINETLTENQPIGGTLARRLNQNEYRATIKQLFGLKDFDLPPGFPTDREHHGFDNVGEGLVLSPPLMQSYSETAQMIADRIFPPKRTTPTLESHSATADDLIISYSSGKVVDGAMRLGMKCSPIQRSCTWPSKIEAKISGIYKFEIELSTFRPKGDQKNMVVKVFARDITSADGVSHTQLRQLHQIEVTSESSEKFEFEAELYEGQTPVIHWANAPLDSDRSDKEELKAYFESREKEIPGYLAAWKTMVSGQNQGFRGGIGWERVKALLENQNLQKLTDKERNAFLKRVTGNPVLYAETVVYDVFENGPALEIHNLKVSGPFQITSGPWERETKKLQELFEAGNETPRAIIDHFLFRAFRRPVDTATLNNYLMLYHRHVASGYSEEEAMHLVIRNTLISPRFLYRSLNEGPLDDYDLATRLSYFLTGAPPDKKLLKVAQSRKLSESPNLINEAMRLLPQKASDPMVIHFTGQWLDTRLLPDIMPDPKFRFQASDEKNAKLEVEHLFQNILKMNLPMTDFINPDFTWTSARIAKNIYGLKDGFDKKKANNIHRVSLPRGGRFGGLLGNSAVMMATANGVDTQPVLRGVWLLENILGNPPPPPPKAVPPITPDTQGAKTPRDLLSAHTKDSSCASCHRKIDPVGFVLENFDPVGRWRDKWPEIDVTVDASSTLPDGTEIKDIIDFKQWLVTNIDQFSQCLAEKLMTYATGRAPNYSEKIEISQIVKDNHKYGNGFRDLLISLINSETFRTK